MKDEAEQGIGRRKEVSDPVTPFEFSATGKHEK
jgi:hypothetical protein